MLSENFQEIQFSQFWPFKSKALVQKNNLQNSISIVTAFFDIGRQSWSPNIVNPKQIRSIENYFEYFSYLAKIKNQLIIFCDEKYAKKILEIRTKEGYRNKTVIFTHKNFLQHPNVNLLVNIIKSKMNGEFHQFVWRPEAPEFNFPEYVLINLFKSFFVNRAINLKKIDSKQIAWVDFGYCRTKDNFDYNIEWQFDCKDKINLFHILPLDSRLIINIIRYTDTYFQGLCILGNKKNWDFFSKEIDKSFESLIDCDLIDDDQTLMLMAWRRNPHQYILHRVDPVSWRVIFNKFNSNIPNYSNITLGKIKERRTPVWIKEFVAALNRVVYKAIKKFKIFF